MEEKQPKNLRITRGGLIGGLVALVVVLAALIGMVVYEHIRINKLEEAATSLEQMSNGMMGPGGFGREFDGEMPEMGEMPDGASEDSENGGTPPELPSEETSSDSGTTSGRRQKSSSTTTTTE